MASRVFRAGYNNRGRPVELARDEAVAAGLTINGLPIVNDRLNPTGAARRSTPTSISSTT